MDNWDRVRAHRMYTYPVRWEVVNGSYTETKTPRGLKYFSIDGGSE